MQVEVGEDFDQEFMKLCSNISSPKNENISCEVILSTVDKEKSYHVPNENNIIKMNFVFLRCTNN